MRPAQIAFPALLQDFFVKRLAEQRGASARTIASYRDAFEILLRFAEKRTRRPPSQLTLQDLDAPFVLAFLEHLEKERGNSPRTRNARLAAVHSFMRYASLREPASLAVAQRVLAIPAKRFDRPLLGFLDRDEMEAVLAAPDRATWSRAATPSFSPCSTTPARASPRPSDCASPTCSSTTDPPSISAARDARSAPSRSGRARSRCCAPGSRRSTRVPTRPSSSTAQESVSRSGVESRLRLAVAAASKSCPSLVGRRISPHTLRHTTAMHLLQGGVDITVIALWLGHESTTTTHHYVEADLAMKEAALRRVADPSPRRIRFRPNDRLLAFLEAL